MSSFDVFIDHLMFLMSCEFFMMLFMALIQSYPPPHFGAYLMHMGREGK